jgi:hypothetical protein
VAEFWVAQLADPAGAAATMLISGNHLYIESPEILSNPQGKFNIGNERHQHASHVFGYLPVVHYSELPMSQGCSEDLAFKC